MYLKEQKIKDKFGNTVIYYKLVSSYRAGNKIQHETLCSLGKLEQLTTAQARKQLVTRMESLLQQQDTLFPDFIDPIIEKMAFDMAEKVRSHQLKQKQKREEERDSKTNIHTSADINEGVDTLIDSASLEHEQAKEIGIEWLCKQALDELQVSKKLTELGWTDKQIDIALLHLIAKAAFPYAEHKMESWLSINSGAKELFTHLPNKITRHHLYDNALKLFKIKTELEQHLSLRTNHLFSLQDKIILYDLTNSYFEGRKEGSSLAQFGRSKEKRRDCKLATLALVVNAEGFLKYSQIYEGNIAECNTLEATLESLSSFIAPAVKKPIIVMDAAFATQENLTLVRNKGYDYLCVNRYLLKNYTTNNKEKKWVTDNRGNKIELSFAYVDNDADTYLKVHSEEKEKKEDAMFKQYCTRLEKELNALVSSLEKPKTTKDIKKILIRLGRIRERNKQVYSEYEVSVEENKENESNKEDENTEEGNTTQKATKRKKQKRKSDTVKRITWKRKEHTKTEGIYFLRTSIPPVELIKEEGMWDIYNTIREVESSFRILKTDLSLRPVYHIHDNSCKAHLFLGVLAYTIVSTIRYKLKQHSIQHDWKNIVRIMNTQKIITSVAQNANKKTVIIRQCTRPIAEVQAIYSATKYKPAPYYTRRRCSP